MKSLLALDVASTTGWAFGPVDSDGAPNLSGVHRFAVKGACDDEVWFAALKWLTDQMTVLSPDVVAIEAPLMTSSAGGASNPKTMMRLIGLQAVLRTVFKAKRPGVAKLIHVQSARKFFIGHGNMPGAEAKKRVKDRCLVLGWAEEDATYDRCDAMCVWAKAAADMSPAFAASFNPLMRAS